MIEKTEISNGVKKIVLILFFIIFFLSVFGFVYGQVGSCPLCPEPGGLVPCGRNCDDPSTPKSECDPCKLCDFFVMLDKWIDRLLFMVVPPLAVLMIAIGGGMYIVSQGNPEMLSRAKRLFTAVVFGLLIIYGAFLIIGLFLNFIGLADWTTHIYEDWWKEGLFEIPCP